MLSSNFLISFQSNLIKLKIIEINNLIELNNFTTSTSNSSNPSNPSNSSNPSSSFTSSYSSYSSSSCNYEILLKDSTSLLLKIKSNSFNIINLILDIQTNIKERIRINNEQQEQLQQLQQQEQEQELEIENILKKEYIYTRFSERYLIQIITVNNEENITVSEKEEIEIFEFYLQQFCRYNVISNYLDFNENDNHQLNDSTNMKAEEKRKVNVVAKGAESTGFLLRKGLKEGGKSAGDIIRYIGNAIPVTGDNTSSSNTSSLSSGYTTLSTTENSEHQSISLLSDTENNNNSSDNSNICVSKIKLTEEEIAAEEKRAEYFRQQAETIHSYTKTATSAIMLPIRMMGRKAVELAQPSPQEEDGWKKAVMDTVGGCGNGIMSIAKGFTEGLQEMGQAIEEVTLQRAIEKYGPEYAERVTRKYLSAGSEGCRAAIKTVSVASMGLHGFVASMAIEGVDYAVNLKDYLVGPVILQNYMQILQYPLTKPIRYFTVLRPWCLAFYYHHNEFSFKPHKIIATSNLDTIPKLRDEKIRDPLTGEIIINHYIEIATLDGSTYALRLDLNYDHSLNSFNSNDIFNNNTNNSASSSNNSNSIINNYIDNLHRMHSSTKSDVIFEWYSQIQDGSRRMETIRKHQSGAKEIAEERWLKRSPRGIGWKWNDYDNIPEVINEDFIYTFVLHSLYISTDQLKEAIEYDSKTHYTEAEAVDHNLLADAFVSNNQNEFSNNNNNNNNNNNVIIGVVLPHEHEQEQEQEYDNYTELTSEREELISSYSEMLGVTRLESIKQLKKYNWDINSALDSYDLLGISSSTSTLTSVSPNLPSSPPSYHSVVAVPIDNATAVNSPEKKSTILDYTPSVSDTAKAVKSTVKSDISSVSVTLKVVTISGLKLKLATTEWTSLTLPSDHSLLSGYKSYRQAIWKPPIIFEIGQNMRIHRDTCSAIELHVTANTKMGIRYKVGMSTFSMEALTFDQQVGSILLPLYKNKKNTNSEPTQFVIGEINLDITKRPFHAYTE